MKTIKSILMISMLIISSTLISQTEGIIKGSVVDEKMESMPFVPVAVMQDSAILYSAQTDVNGEFTIKNIIPGKYKVRAQFAGYNIQEINNIVVNPNQTRTVSLNMDIATKGLPITVVTASFVEPPFDARMTTLTPISQDQIATGAIPKTDIIAIITLYTPGALPTNDGKGMYVRGSRVGSTAYYVDGTRTIEIPDVPGLGIGGIDVLTGGIPAQYGDCTGGVVVITTKDYRWEMNRKRNQMEDRQESQVIKKKENIVE